MKRAHEEQREAFLKQVLTPGARERLNRIALVKPEKARQVEEAIIQGAMRGKFVGQLDENKLISMLDQGVTPNATAGVQINHKRNTFDDDSDEDLSDL